MSKMRNEDAPPKSAEEIFLIDFTLQEQFLRKILRDIEKKQQQNIYLYAIKKIL